MATLDEILELIDSMPEPPKASLQALNMMEDTNISLSKVAEFLALDESLTAKLLKMSNSAYYGFQGKVKTVQEALTRIGLNLAKSTLLLSMVNNSGIEPKPFFKELWSSALYTAFLSKEVALRLQLDEVNVCFTGGLLCDIGQVFMNEADWQQFSQLAQLARENELSIHLCEQHHYSFNHTKIGLKVAEAWSLPHIYQTIIQHHHEPKNAHGKVLPNEFKMIMAVHTANALAPLFTQMTGKGIQVDCLKLAGYTLPAETLIRSVLQKFDFIKRDVENIMKMMFE
jgi:HD-like signal output (HDOD) protein